MTEKQIKNYASSLFKRKKISCEQFRNAVNNLEKLRERNPAFYYLNMGKLHTTFGNPEEAIFYLEKMIKLNPENPSAYYNLYKCYVKSNNILLAQINLEKFLERNRKEVNFELVIKIMNAIHLIDKDILEYLDEDLSAEYTSTFGYNNLDGNTELKDIYLDVIKSFNVRDYLECINKLELMNFKIHKLSYPMEVDTLIKLIKYLQNKEIIHYAMYLEDNKNNEAANETYANIFFRLYELGYYSTNSFLRKVEEIILNVSHVKGDIILDKISNVKDFEKYQDMIDYLKGVIREKKEFLLLTKERKEAFNEKSLIAKDLYIKKQNGLCLEAYLALKDEFNLPICSYYIGKILFRIGNFQKAREYFLNYLKQGGVKTEKTYLFLARIEKTKKNYDASKRYIDMMQRIHETFLRDFEYLPDYQYRIMKKSGYTGSRGGSIDVVKSEGIRTISMKEEDFTETVSSQAIDFHSANTREKLIIIRNLLICGDIKTANKLLEKVERECDPQERPKIRQFKKNKKLYMNQIRNN